jgi:adenylate cyclase
MAGETVQRRLAAILVADVAGYSRLMERDETGTLAALKNHRKTILQPVVSRHHGRIVKLMGDGVLVDFASAVNAVACAVDLQKQLAIANGDLPDDKRIELRIGINLGDVLVEGSDLYGEGVNIAARLEGLAEPGRIIVSETIVSHVRGKVAFGFEDLGEKKLKNIDGRVRIYAVSDSGYIAKPAPNMDMPAIAVLPFVNMSGDPEQEYFSDGITEDIITDLSKISALHVVSRNTAFTFKGKPVEIAQIAQRLKVAHILEGSVRKAGGRVRITAQLIDAERDNHIWAERYDRDMTDIFALQDEITQSIVAALKVRLLPEERKAVENRSTQNHTAYQLYLQARHHLGQHGLKNLETAIRFAEQALEIDPNYALPWSVIGHCQSALHLRGRTDQTGLSAVERALSLDPKLAEAHSTKGRILLELGRHDEAIAEHEEAIRLNSRSFEVRHVYGRTLYLLTRGEEAIEQFERAAELDQSAFLSLGF